MKKFTIRAIYDHKDGGSRAFYATHIGGENAGSGFNFYIPQKFCPKGLKQEESRVSVEVSEAAFEDSNAIWNRGEKWYRMIFTGPDMDSYCTHGVEKWMPKLVMNTDSYIYLKIKVRKLG